MRPPALGETAGRRQRSTLSDPRGATDWWLVAIVMLALGLCLFQIDWGLPNGNHSWAADAIGPVTVLGIVHRSFASWNSGWYWFKYPLGYPFLLAVCFAPYLGYLYATAGWRPVAAYPYGFDEPERALFALALSGRFLSVAFAVGSVLLAYGIARRVFGLLAGRLAAFFVATAYPIVYYAHTTNLDIGYLFWLLLALYAAILAADCDALLPWVGLGGAAAMAVSSKEQAFALLLPLPFLLLVLRWRREGTPRVLFDRPVRWMVAAALATEVVANNVLFNPHGFVGRLAFLLGRPLEPLSARLAPVEFSLWKGAKEWTYLQQLWDAFESGLGISLAVLAIGGALLALRHRRAAIWLLLPAASYYFFSLRGLDLIRLRYTLPLLVIAVILAAGLVEGLLGTARSPAGRRAVLGIVAVLAALSLARAGELHFLFWNDPRYQAEEWMSANLDPAASIEVYQKPAYLPRFPSHFSLARVPISQRSVAGLEERSPDLIVLSSASAKSITHVWSADWRETGSLLTPRPEAVEMRTALEEGELPYRAVASFWERPRLLRLAVTSIDPRINIYARTEG